MLALLCFAQGPLGGSASARAQQAAQESTEYVVKAAAINHFVTRYVKWPESAYKTKTDPFVVAVLGKDPFGKSLAEALKGKSVGEHPIKLVNFASSAELEHCQLIFVPVAGEKQLPKLLEFYKDKHVLIVAESTAAVAQGGAHIATNIENAKLRLSINPAAAKRAKLELSSELLKLARIVPDPAERGK